MKRSVIVFLSFWLILLTGMTALSQVADDIQNAPRCKYCNMDRQQYAHSRMFVQYDDGTTLGTCCIHCLAVDLALNIDKAPVSMEVGDYNTKKLVDAETATWVIGGGQPGVMTKRAKWAFEKKDEAEKFVQANGGTVATFDEAMRATYEDMNEDTKMIRERRKMKRMRMQEKKPE